MSDIDHLVRLQEELEITEEAAQAILDCINEETILKGGMTTKANPQPMPKKNSCTPTEKPRVFKPAGVKEEEEAEESEVTEGLRQPNDKTPGTKDCVEVGKKVPTNNDPRTKKLQEELEISEEAAEAILSCIDEEEIDESYADLQKKSEVRVERKANKRYEKGDLAGYKRLATYAEKKSDNHWDAHHRDFTNRKGDRIESRATSSMREEEEEQSFNCPLAEMTEGARTKELADTIMKKHAGQAMNSAMKGDFAGMDKHANAAAFAHKIKTKNEEEVDESQELIDKAKNYVRKTTPKARYGENKNDGSGERIGYADFGRNDVHNIKKDGTLSGQAKKELASNISDRHYDDDAQKTKRHYISSGVHADGKSPYKYIPYGQRDENDPAAHSIAKHRAKNEEVDESQELIDRAKQSEKRFVKKLSDPDGNDKNIYYKIKVSRDIADRTKVRDRAAHTKAHPYYKSLCDREALKYDKATKKSVARHNAKNEEEVEESLGDVRRQAERVKYGYDMQVKRAKSPEEMDKGFEGSTFAGKIAYRNSSKDKTLDPVAVTKSVDRNDRKNNKNFDAQVDRRKQALQGLSKANLNTRAKYEEDEEDES